jgi:hypothetical protein
MGMSNGTPEGVNNAYALKKVAEFEISPQMPTF